MPKKHAYYVSIITEVERTYRILAEDEDEAIALCRDGKGDLEEENDGQQVSAEAELAEDE